VVLADDVLQAEAQIELGLEIFIFFDDAALIERPIDRHFQLGVDERLGQKVEGAGADRLHGHFDRAVAGEQDHRHAGMVLTAMGEHVEAVAIGKPHVAQYQVGRFAVDRRHARRTISRRVELVALLAQPIGHRFEHVAIVVDEEEGAPGHKGSRFGEVEG
jgi:hypothetical protein